MIRRLIILLLIVGCGTEPEDVYGCTVEDACNFNSNANIFDNSCFYEDVVCLCDEEGCQSGTYIYTTSIEYDTPECSGVGEEYVQEGEISYTFFHYGRGELVYTIEPNEYNPDGESYTETFSWTQSGDQVNLYMKGMEAGYDPIIFTLSNDSLILQQSFSSLCLYHVFTKN